MPRNWILRALLAISAGLLFCASPAPAAITYNDWFASVSGAQFPQHTTSPNQVSLNWGPGTYGHAGGGGEFLVKTAGGDVITYQNGARSFTTFCLEQGEHIYLATAYDISVDPVAYYGTNISQSVVSGPGDPLDASTAVLYGAYFDGSLSTRVLGFTYSTDVSANALQRGIWSLEDNLTLGSSATDLLAQSLVSYASTLVSNADRAYYVAHVGVMNLWTPSPASSPGSAAKAAQSQLMWLILPAPAPLPATPEPATLAIWAVGVALVGGCSSKRRK